jgi:hypothetical protein
VRDGLADMLRTKLSRQQPICVCVLALLWTLDAHGVGWIYLYHYPVLFIDMQHYLSFVGWSLLPIFFAEFGLVVRRVEAYVSCS